jgi:glycosyltransferase involved in cell wall biosynthesis
MLSEPTSQSGSHIGPVFRGYRTGERRTMHDLSVIIPARNEEFLERTIQDVLSNAEADTEVIAILDGYWPDPPIEDHPKVTFVHHTTPVGQRAATNEGVRLSNAKFMMKLDAHCCLDKGFDVKLMADCEYDWTVIPRMYNFHVFDWECLGCGNRIYQANLEGNCPLCNGSNFVKRIVWKPRLRRRSDFYRFDKDLHFQYWPDYEKRPEAKSDIADLMSNIGACWFMHRDRYLETEGLDEKTGSWGQVGTEVSCKTWLSGGRLVVNKKTWFSHFFRVGKLNFPYSISGDAQERAKVYSRDFWLNNRWPKQVHPLSWIIEKFKPVPTWDEEAVCGVSESADKPEKREEDNPQLMA